VHAQIGTVRQLEILLAVYECGSITRASEALFLTQPSVSAQLAKLSDSVGLDLYYTVGKRIKFTKAGEILVDGARKILKNYEYLNMDLAQLKGLDQGELDLAVVTTAKYFIPHLIGDFIQLFPNVNVRFSVGNRQQIIDRAAGDFADFYVFSHPPDIPNLELFEFLPNPLYVIAPENHPLVGRKHIPLKELEKHRFLMREQGSGTRFAIENFMNKAGVNLKLQMTIESNEAIKHAVMSGLGISILSEHTLTFGGLT